MVHIVALYKRELVACRAVDVDCATRKVQTYLNYRNRHPELYANLTLPNKHTENAVNGGFQIMKGVACGRGKVAIAMNIRMQWDRSPLEVLQMQVRDKLQGGTNMHRM
jgi:hypothetical protein